jgi:hypothetical protein
MLNKTIIALALIILSVLGVSESALAQVPQTECPSQTTSCRYTHISSNTTTLVKSGAGILHTVTISTKGASANTATIYDSLTGTGTVIGVIDTTSNTATVLYDIGFYTGLTIVTATGTSADLTVSYH